YAFIGCGALVLHGVRCGGMPGLVGLALARGNNRDVRRTEASVAGSAGAWSRWAEQVLDGLPNQEIDALLKLHPLLRDRDLRVWCFGANVVTLDELVARIVAKDELHVHLGEVSYDASDHYNHIREGYSMDQEYFESEFQLFGHVVIMPQFGPANVWSSTNDRFPWFLGVSPIDYRSRLEAALTSMWGGFEKHEEGAVVGEVDGDEIRRAVTLYRRIATG
ncbi:MAG: hypothetical protein ACREA0_28595, partial [bacterium]